MSARAIDPANVTGDDLQYQGGGALYVSSDGPVVVRGCDITDNVGPNGGELERRVGRGAALHFIIAGLAWAGLAHAELGPMHRLRPAQ
jgi:hypothetical protein